jgi:hypothetical protein
LVPVGFVAVKEAVGWIWRLEMEEATGVDPSLQIEAGCHKLWRRGVGKGAREGERQAEERATAVHGEDGIASGREARWCLTGRRGRRCGAGEERVHEAAAFVEHPPEGPLPRRNRTRQLRKWKGKEREILETRAPKPTPSFWGTHARPAEGAHCASPPHFASEGSDTIDVDNLRTTRESHIYHMPDFHLY